MEKRLEMNSENDLPSTSKEDYNSDSSLSSDGNIEKERCPICLLSFKSQELGKPNICDHLFCLICISEWTRVVRTCPCDRKEFNKIVVFENADNRSVLRTITLDQATVNLDEFLQDDDVTYCEICNQCDREDQLLLCDSCDLGYHMGCLATPLTEIPANNWYCDNCFSSEEDSDVAEEVNFLNEDIEENGGLPATRLRSRPHTSGIVRTRQSERILNVLSRNRIASDSGEENQQNESQPGPSTSTRRAPATKARKKTKKRRRTRRRYRTVVTEYDVDSDDKFALKAKKIRCKIRRKRRKQARKSRSERKSRTRSDNQLSSLKNSNTFDLQCKRYSAGITNFNIFQPTNQLDYVPDEDIEIPDFYNDSGGNGSTLVARSTALLNMNPLMKKQVHIKNRVTRNQPNPTSVNILDSIMQQQEMMLSRSSFQRNFKVETGGKVVCTASPKSNDAPADGGEGVTRNTGTTNSNWNQVNPSQTSQSNSNNSNNQSFGSFNNSASNNNPRYSNSTADSNNYQSSMFVPTYSSKNFQKPKDEDEEDEEHQLTQQDQDTEESCPNFSIYSADSIGIAKDPENSQTSLKETPKLYAEEDVDLVQEDGEDIPNQNNDIYDPESPTNFDDDPDESEVNLENVKSPDEPKSPDVDDLENSEDFQLHKSPQTFDNPASPEPEEIDDSALNRITKPVSMEFAKKNKNLQKGSLDMFDESSDDSNSKKNFTDTKDSNSNIENEEEPHQIEEEEETQNLQDASPAENQQGSEKANAVRSYTPPIDDKKPEKKKEKREIERYDVRKRIKTKDEFGRNRSRSRFRSKSRNRSKSRSASPSNNRRGRKRDRSSSVSSPENRGRGRIRKARSPSRSRKTKLKKIRTPSKSPRKRRSRSRSASSSFSHSKSRSFSISPSRSRSRNRHMKMARKTKARMTPSPLPKYRNRSKSKKKSRSREKRLKKHKGRRKSRTRTPPLPTTSKRIQTPSPPRKFSSYSESQKIQKKSKKKKNEKSSKHPRSAVTVPSTNVKEVFTSGENILVSVNFNNNQHQKSPGTPPPRKSPNKEINLDPKEIVDITTKKKLDSVKPIAIIDLDRSPFKILTPEYNIIELSDSDNDKQIQSPDSHESNKLYDPFEVLASPFDNVTSSYETFGNDVAVTSASQQQQKAQEQLNPPPLLQQQNPAKDDKLTDQSVISIFNSTSTSIPCISASSGDENVDNIVTSSSANNKSAETVIESVQSISQNSPYLDMDVGMDSPYSPGSADYDDWFAAAAYPPEDDSKKKGKSSGAPQKGDKANTFDVLFGSTSPVQMSARRKVKAYQKGLRSSHPNKLLVKLNRQERAIEESKIALKPHYSRRLIDKTEYKEVLRKAVPKICHNKSGEINPIKIKNLIDAYVKKIRYNRKHGAANLT